MRDTMRHHILSNICKIDIAKVSQSNLPKELLRPSIASLRIIFIYMKQDCQQPDLEQLSLPELLQQPYLTLDQILATNNAHNRIKRSLAYFLHSCAAVPAFAQRLIMIGLRSPVEQPMQQAVGGITFIAADILTTDSEELADFYILPGGKFSQYEHESEPAEGNTGQAEEKIESDTAVAQLQPHLDKYKCLKLVLDYLNSEQLDENCLNYISKGLQIVARRKLTQFLQFFSQNPCYLLRMVEIAHFPSIALLLAKLLTEDEQKPTQLALQVKQQIIRLVLEKIRRDLGKAETAQTLGCVEDVLNSTRYGDFNQRTPLQNIADQALCQHELSFHLHKLLQALHAQNSQERLLYQALNAAGYLAIVVNRMNMDEQDQGFAQSQEFKPTQIYEVQQLYGQFCGVVVAFRRFWHFKVHFEANFWLCASKVLQPLILMTKHSRFGLFYQKAARPARQSALQTLICITCQCQIRGIVLQGVTRLLEEMLAEEERMMENSSQAVFPGELYEAIARHAESIGVMVKSLLEESTNQRNRNQNGIFFRKILLLLDNYFKHTAALQKYPNTGSLQNLFPAFSLQNCRLFAKKAAILNHPNGKSAKKISQFQFIHKNNVIIRSLSPQLEEQQTFEEKVVQNKMQAEGKPFAIVFKLEGKLKALKQQTMQKKGEKVQAIQNSQVKENRSINLLKAEQPSKAVQQNPQSNEVDKKDKPGANFYVKHLTIY